MAKIYTALIQKGLKTIDDVPARIRAEVEALLAEQDHEQGPSVAAGYSDGKGEKRYGYRVRDPYHQGQENAGAGSRHSAGAGRADS